MPVGARILVNLPEVPGETLLLELSAQLQLELEIEADDFYDVPLKLLVDVESQDLPFVNENSVWLELMMKADFYRPCYERGDIEMYVACAEWLENHLPDAAIYYGTDCAPDAVPFDAFLREKYLRYCDKFSDIGQMYRSDRSEEEQAQLWALWESC